MVEASGVLNPSLRHIQKAIQLAAQIGILSNDQWSSLSAYLILLKTIDEFRFSKLLALDPVAAGKEAAQFEVACEYRNPDEMNHLHAIMAYLADRARFDSVLHSLSSGVTKPDSLPIYDRRVLSETDRGRLVPQFQRYSQGLFRALTAK